MSRMSVGVNPSRASDGVGKLYADRLRRGTYPPASGYGSLSPDILSVNTAGNALTSGKITMHPCPVAPGTYSGFYVLPSTLQSGTGVGLSYSFGVYWDDGSGCWPDTTAIIASGTSLDLTSGGGAVNVNHTAAFTANWSPTDYRLAWFYFLPIWTTAPTTLPVLAAVSNALYQISPPSSIPISTRIRGISLTGQTAAPTTAITTGTSGLSFEGGNGVYALALRRA